MLHLNIKNQINIHRSLGLHSHRCSVIIYSCIVVRVPILKLKEPRNLNNIFCYKWPFARAHAQLTAAPEVPGKQGQTPTAITRFHWISSLTNSRVYQENHYQKRILVLRHGNQYCIITKQTKKALEAQV